jgi:hypothetical protein
VTLTIDDLCVTYLLLMLMLMLMLMLILMPLLLPTAGQHVSLALV